MPGRIDEALKKALSVRQENRYESLSEFLHDLNHPGATGRRDGGELPLVERNPVLLWQLIALG